MENSKGEGGEEYQKAVLAALEKASAVPLAESAAKISDPAGLAKAMEGVAPLLEKVPSMVPGELKEAFDIAMPVLKAITQALGKPGFPGMNQVMGLIAMPKVAEAFQKIADYDAKFCKPAK